MSKTRVYCTGCSWTQFGGKNDVGWPIYIDPNEFDVTTKAYAGRGLSDLYDILEREDLSGYDVIVVQLPTIVREFSPGGTMERFLRMNSKIKEVGKTPAEELALRMYLDAVGRINSLHQNVVFFVFNVGGYPFRHPYDFGVSFEGEFIKKLITLNIQTLCLSFENIPGCANNEKRLTTRSRPPPNHDVEGWSIIHPPDKVIYDAHPNNSTALEAGEYVQNYMLAQRRRWPNKDIQNENKTP